MLLKDLHIFLGHPPLLWCDNLSAISLAFNPVFHARTKHIEVDYHFVREKVLRKDLVVQYVSTIDQTADVLTKGLHQRRFKFLPSKLSVTDCPNSLRGDISST